MRFESVLQIEGHEDEDIENMRIEEAEEKTDLRIEETKPKEKPAEYNNGKKSSS
jgi:hypothetical protein